MRRMSVQWGSTPSTQEDGPPAAGTPFRGYPPLADSAACPFVPAAKRSTGQTTRLSARGTGGSRHDTARPCHHMPRREAARMHC